MDIRIKTEVTGISLFRLLYELRNLNLNWKNNPTIETLLGYIWDKPNLFLTFDGQLDVDDYDVLDYNHCSWNEFKAMIERELK